MGGSGSVLEGLEGSGGYVRMWEGPVGSSRVLEGLEGSWRVLKGLGGSHFRCLSRRVSHHQNSLNFENVLIPIRLGWGSAYLDIVPNFLVFFCDA